MKLDSRTALVTGATKGVGRGIALELARAGACVFVTGRSNPNPEGFDDRITFVRCDHHEDEQVDAVFDQILREAGTIDILVNNVWGGYERLHLAQALLGTTPLALGRDVPSRRPGARGTR